MRKASRSAHRFSVRRSKTTMLLAGIASASFMAGSAYAGGGGPSLTQTAQQVYVDDFATTGTLNVNYTVDSWDSNALTQNMILGSATSSQIKLSADSSYLVFGGYNAPIGTPSEYLAPYLSRAVGVADGYGNIDTTTQWQGSSGTPVPNALWLGGTNPILTAAGKYSVTRGTQIASTPVANFTTPTPIVGNYFGGAEYITSATTGYQGLSQVSGGTVTHLPGFPTVFNNSTGTNSASDFVMTHSDVTNPYGYDTIYVANTSVGLQKWVYNSGTSSYSNVWTMASNSSSMSFSPDPTNTFLKSLTMTTDGLGDNILYGIAVDGTVKGSGTATYDNTYLVNLSDLDTSGVGGAPTSFSLLAASTANEEFGGVSFAPSGPGFGAGDLAVLQIGGPAVPEPTSLTLMGVAAAAFLGRRRRVRT